MEIKITRTADTLSVTSHYNTDFVAAARKLGGKWNGTSKSWQFDARDERRVRDLCITVYGTDGQPTKTVTVRLTALGNIEEYGAAVVVCGRDVARARGRDSGATIGDGVVFLKGSPKSGGSMKNWKTIIPDGAVFEVRDVPERMIESISDVDYTWQVVESENPDDLETELARLIADRDAIQARIDELRAKLA